MPNDLAALLVDEGAAPAEAVARALDRQREQGGALDTALLEEGVLREDELLPWLARAAELPAAPASAWEAADARARRVFPSRVAERHGLAPFALEGRELSLVATFPVDLALLDEISFMLSLDLVAHVGPEWRVRELIQRLYGAPLSPRLAALAAASGAGGEPGEAPPAVEAPPEPEPAAAPPAPPAPTGFARDGAEPLEPLAAALQQALEDPSLFDDEAPPAPGAEGTAAAAEDASAAAEPEPERPPQDRSAPPRWTYDDARAALAAARHRDDVVLVAIRYARDFFEYAAVFAVTRDAVAGHDALGDHDERDRARAVAIWSSDPGIFKTVVETRAPYLGPVSRDAAGNEAILSGLGRGTPRTVLLYPVLVRDRPICVVYADNGEAPVSPGRLGQLLLLLSGVGAALERIIQDRKRRRGARRPAAARPAVEAPPAPPAAGPPPREVPPPAAAAERRVPADVAEAAVEPEEESVRFGWGADAVEDPLPAAPADAAELPRALPPVGLAADEPERAPPPPAPAPSASREPLPAAPPAAREPLPAATPATAQELEPLPLGTLADRALDPDAQVAAAACDALARRRRESGIRAAEERLRRALLSGLSGKAAKAARALGAVRDAEAIPLLIQVLETSEPETARAAADALAAITLQRLGADARRWLGWWKQNRGRGRAEWLFSGLTSPDRETRVAAAVELSTAAPPPVAYSADLPPAERERTARAWAGWWARSGHVL